MNCLYGLITCCRCMEYLISDQLTVPLIAAICEVCHKRPVDPIEFIARYLFNYRLHHQVNMTKCAKKISSTSNSEISLYYPLYQMSNLKKKLLAEITFHEFSSFAKFANKISTIKCSFTVYYCRYISFLQITIY